MLADTGLPAAHLKLEITETEAARYSEGARQLLQEITWPGASNSRCYKCRC